MGLMGWTRPSRAGRASQGGPPAEVLLRAGARGRVLAALETEGTWLLGTRSDLLIVEGETTRIPWERVENVRWNQDDSELEVSELGEFGRARPEHHFRIEDPGTLLELMRERVTASVVLQRRVPVDTRRGLLVIARRSPVGGPVEWFFEYDAGLDPTDPVVHDLASRALAQARSEIGEELI